MKVEFATTAKPDVNITMSYEQAQKLCRVLLRVNGDNDLDDLWEKLDDLVIDELKGFKFVNSDYVEVTSE